MITEEEYRKAREVVKQYQAQQKARKLRDRKAVLPKTSFLKDCQMSTRTHNMMRTIGEVFILKSSFGNSRWQELRLQDFEGLERQKLRGIRGVGPDTLSEIVAVLKSAGVELR